MASVGASENDRVNGLEAAAMMRVLFAADETQREVAAAAAIAPQGCGPNSALRRQTVPRLRRGTVKYFYIIIFVRKVDGGEEEE